MKREYVYIQLRNEDGSPGEVIHLRKDLWEAFESETIAAGVTVEWAFNHWLPPFIEMMQMGLSRIIPIAADPADWWKPQSPNVPTKATGPKGGCPMKSKVEHSEAIAPAQSSKSVRNRGSREATMKRTIEIFANREKTPFACFEIEDRKYRALLRHARKQGLTLARATVNMWCDYLGLPPQYVGRPR